MRKIMPLWLVLACGFAAIPAYAADEAAAPAQPAKEDKICRKVASTGSILSTRLCLSSAEWAEIKKRRAYSEDKAGSQKLDPSARMGGGGVPWDIPK